MSNNYAMINHDVMVDTKHQYEKNAELKQMVQNAIGKQFMVSQEENIDQPWVNDSQTEYAVVGERSFGAAKSWAKENRVAVLNFANNHSIGGAPFSAGAQEESLCRCSTLLPCLEAMKSKFYQKHCAMFASGELGYMGNDDLIYTPDVCVFKTDELADPVIPKMMPRKDWYMVDVITSAAPQLKKDAPLPTNYGMRIRSRIKKILDVAAMQQVDVLILGAWGCGAFHNPTDVVVRTFHELLQHYNFKKVIFALSSKEVHNSPFYKTFVPNAAAVASTKDGYSREYTPEHITSLNDGEIFVFGSNIRGIHAGGAAAFANARLGAEWGVGEGLTGKCYALPTMEGGVDYIGGKVQNFLDCARKHPELKFYVTPIACGIAGFRPSQIAPLFKDAMPMENVILPREFVKIIEGK